jgi:hypothetical protein
VAASAAALTDFDLMVNIAPNGDAATLSHRSTKFWKKRK